MDIPSLFMIPSAVSSGKVHSVLPNSTDADFDFNRDSDATRVNSEGLIERVGYFGSELVTNGNFDTDSNWSKTSGATISNGKATITVTGGGYQSVAQSISLSNTKKYRLTAVVNGTSGKAATFVDNSANNGGLTTSNGVITFNGQDQNVDITWTANSNSFEIEIIRNGSGDFSFTVDNVSVKEVTGDRARLNYEIEGGLVNTKPSLLLEPQSTNLFTKSNDVDATAATKLDNQITSPEGLQNAALYVENTATASHGAIKSAIFPTAGATTYTLSVFAKAKERHLLRLNLYADGTSNLTDNFDLINGTVSDANSTIEDFGNGWFRCSTTKTVTNSGGYNFAAVYMGKATNNYYYAGDGQSGLYLFGFQLEQQSYPTSYIPTNGSSQTRAAETCNGAGTSSILPNEGIFYFEFKDIGLTHPNQSSISISGSNSNNRILIYRGSGGAVWQLQIKAGGSTILNTDLGLSGADSIANYNKVAVRYKSGSNRRYVNGTRISPNGSVETTTFTLSDDIQKIQFLPDASASSNQGYGKFRDIRVYNTKEMTDSEVDILLTKITS